MSTIKGYTPCLDTLTTKYGLVTSGVYGKVYRYENMKKVDGVCKATQSRIARELGLTRQTVNKHLNILLNAKYIKVVGGGSGEAVHYKTTGKAGIEFVGIAYDHLSNKHTRGVKEIDTPLSTKHTLKKQVKETSKKIESLPFLEEIIDTWILLFPNKPKPRSSTLSYRKKIATRLKDSHFVENWKLALTTASESPTLQKESWFSFEYFIRNDQNYQKCLDKFMQWKDDEFSVVESSKPQFEEEV